MGTRGLVGWVIDDQIKATYNHFDSYPSGLGADVITYVQSRLDTVETWREKVRDVTVLDVDPEAPAPDHLVRRATSFGLVNQTVGGPSPSITYYQALRGAQGDLAAYEQVGVIIDGADFATDSLFCEYAYLVNLDEGLIEVYVGFQTEPHQAGRFANTLTEADRGYWPIALLTTVPFSDLVPAKDEDETIVRDLVVARIESLDEDD